MTEEFRGLVDLPILDKPTDEFLRLVDLAPNTVQLCTSVCPLGFINLTVMWCLFQIFIYKHKCDVFLWSHIFVFVNCLIDSHNFGLWKNINHFIFHWHGCIYLQNTHTRSPLLHVTTDASFHYDCDRHTDKCPAMDRLTDKFRRPFDEICLWRTDQSMNFWPQVGVLMPGR